MKYFLHDTSAFEDEKITELYINFGYEGVGLFFTILEKLAFQEKPVKTIVLKKQLRVGKKLEKTWNFLEEIQLISSNNGETFNKQLLNFSEKYLIKKEKNRKRISEWRENQEVTENVTCNEHVRNTPKDKISKVKRIEVKKEDEKETSPPPQIEIDNSLFENLNEDFAKYIQSCINGQMPISLKKDLASKRDTYFQLIKNMNAFNNTIKHQRHRNEDLTAFQKRVDESIVSMLKEQRDGKFEQSWQNIADLGQHAINFFRLQTKKQEQNGVTKRNNGAIETINNDYSGNAGFN